DRWMFAGFRDQELHPSEKCAERRSDKRPVDGTPVLGSTRPFLTPGTGWSSEGGLRSVAFGISAHAFHGRDEPAIDCVKLERLAVSVHAITTSACRVDHVPRPAVLSFGVDCPSTDVDGVWRPGIDQAAGIEERVAWTGIKRVPGELGANLGSGERRSRRRGHRARRRRAEWPDRLAREDQRFLVLAARVREPE